MKKYILYALAIAFVIIFFTSLRIHLTQKNNNPQKNTSSIFVTHNTQSNENIVESQGKSTIQAYLLQIKNEKDTLKKIYLIESIFESKEIIGQSELIYHMLLSEKDSAVIKPLSKLLMLSLDDRTNVISMMVNLINNEDTAHFIVDYIPEYLSSDEIASIYQSSRDTMNEEYRDALLTFYINNSILNGKNPFSEQYMKMEYEGRKDHLNLSVVRTLSMAIVMGEKNSEYINMQKNNFYIQTLIKQKPKNMSDNELYMWIKANIILSNNEIDKKIFIDSIYKDLTDAQKYEINKTYNNIIN